MELRGTKKTQTRSIWVYFIPIILILLAVYLYPLCYTFWVASRKTEFFSVKNYCGISNFVKLFTDKNILTNICNTLIYAGGTLCLALLIGLFAAMLVQKTTRMNRLLRTFLLLPWLMSQATAGTIWFWFLNPLYGPVAYIARLAGVTNFTIFSNPRLAMIALIVITAWWSYPQSMLFFLPALQAVPSELKESVQIDGGGRWVSFWNVTFPFIRNTALTVSLVLTMLYFQMVTMILVTTSGGPIRSTETLSMRIYNQLFTYFDLSGAATSAILLLGINVFLTVLLIRARRREALL